MANYSTIADVRAFGVEVADAADAAITLALNRAKLKIDRYCGASFATPASATITRDDVVNGIVPLPPYSAITAVTVWDVAIAADDYEVRDYGIKFVERFIDADGWANGTTTAVPSRHPVKVSVTATFGSPVDDIIVLCSTMLAAGLALLTSDDLLAPAQIATTNAGGVYTAQRRPVGKTTGNLEVDSMLDDYLYGGGMVN